MLNKETPSFSQQDLSNLDMHNIYQIELYTLGALFLIALPLSTFNPRELSHNQGAFYSQDQNLQCNFTL